MNASARLSDRKLLPGEPGPLRSRPSPAAADPPHPGDLLKRFHVHAHVEDLTASIAFYSSCSPRPRPASRRLRQMDARGPAHQLRDLHARRPGRHRPSGHPDRHARRARRLHEQRQAADWPCSTRAKRAAATRAARSTGSRTRKASRGSTSTRWTTSRVQRAGERGFRGVLRTAAHRRRRCRSGEGQLPTS